MTVTESLLSRRNNALLVKIMEKKIKGGFAIILTYLNVVIPQKRTDPNKKITRIILTPNNSK